MDLQDKIAIITGSTGALGAELAMSLARAGCHCVCHYNSNEEKTGQLVDNIKSIPRKTSRCIGLKAHATTLRIRTHHSRK